MADWTKIFTPPEPHSYVIYTDGQQVLLMPEPRGDNAPLAGWYSPDGRTFSTVPVDLSALGTISTPPVLGCVCFHASRVPWPLSGGRVLFGVEGFQDYAEAQIAPDRIVAVRSAFVPPEPDVVNVAGLAQDAQGVYWVGAKLRRDSAIGRIYRSDDMATWTQVGGDLRDGVGRVYRQGERLFFSAYGRVIEVCSGELVERAKFKDWVRSVHVDDRGGIHVFMDCFVGYLGAGQKRTKNGPLPFSPTASGSPEGVAVEGGYLMARGGLWSSKDGLTFQEETAFPGNRQIFQMVPFGGGALVFSWPGELYLVRA